MYKNQWITNLNLDDERKRASGVGVITNHTKRNIFFNEFIQKNCKDKICYDVGSGNGIFAILAAHADAKHVYAFENNPFCLEFLKKMINDLDLKNKITILNKTFKSSEVCNYKIDYPDVILNGIDFNPNEVFDILLPNVNFFPQEYGIDIFSLEINEKTYLNLKEKYSFSYPNISTSGINLDTFDQKYNDIINEYNRTNPLLLASKFDNFAFCSNSKLIVRYSRIINTQKEKIFNFLNLSHFKKENLNFFDVSKFTYSIFFIKYFSGNNNDKVYWKNKIYIKNKHLKFLTVDIDNNLVWFE